MLNKNQYLTADNFNARVYLNAKFRTNKDSWSGWIFRHFTKDENLKILETGCGTGLLWLANKDKIPDSWEIILTDYSEGMLETTRKNLSKVNHDFSFVEINTEEIGFPDNSLDVVIANLMLYHVENRGKAISEIRRVLKKNGIFYSTTFGRNNMIELNNIFAGFFSFNNNFYEKGINPFSLENGYSQLKEFFSEIKTEKYQDSLEINEIEPIIKYYSSFNNMYDNTVILKEVELENFRNYLKDIFAEKKAIHVTKDMGMFICRK